MKKMLKTIFCFILCAFLLAGCRIDISGINNVVDAVKPIKLSENLKTVTVTPSDKINAKKLDFKNISFVNNSEAKITIIPSDETKVEATFPEDMEKYGFSITVKGGEIDIFSAKQSNFVTKDFQITIYANIEEVEILGGISIEMDAEKSGRVDMDVKGAADVYVYNVDTKAVEIDIAGAAAVDLSGKTDLFELELDGAGSIDAKSFVCKKAEVKISGAGSAEISVTDNLLADMDGVGTLRYYGDPLVENISGGLTDVEQVSKEVYGG